MCEGSFLPSSFGPHQKHTEFESSLRSYPISPCAFFAKGWGLLRGVEGNLLSRVFRRPFHACRQVVLVSSPSERLAREGRQTQPSRPCPTSSISAPQERNISAQRVSAG